MNLSLKQQLLFSSPDYVLTFQKAPFGGSTPFAVQITSGLSCSCHMLGYALLPGSMTEISPPPLLERGHLQSSRPMHATHGGGSGGEFLCAAFPKYDYT